MQRLRRLLLDIEGKSYKAYKAIAGRYKFQDYDLSIDHVQGDPFALASRISLFVDMKRAGLPQVLWQTAVRRIALEDHLGRMVKQAINQHVKGNRGSGGSGVITIATSGQQVLQRNAVLITADTIEMRLTLGLPAKNRRAAGKEAIAMFFDELPQLVRAGLYFENLSAAEAKRHVETIEDQHALRQWLNLEGLVAFVANGALLPRKSGVDDRPMADQAIPFVAPESLTRTTRLPNSGELSGLAIPRGVTLIVGGGFHGKSTLLHALEYGVYDHVPGDGRETVVTLENAVKIRAEDGRAISKVDISPFIDNLPFGRDTVQFTSENASGSTSQAANIIEALACGTELLLIDEDTSATNFMIRDTRMQQLVAADKEPITPLLYRVCQLSNRHGVSSVIVMGGSGDYFDVADTVIMMDAYQPLDVTAIVKKLARPISQTDNAPADFKQISSRCPATDTLDPSRGNRAIKIETKGIDQLWYGEHRIDLSQVEQLVDIGQTGSIGLMIHYFAQHYAHECTSMIDGLCMLLEEAELYGLDRFSPYKVGNLALPRLYELAAAINRIRNGNWH